MARRQSRATKRREPSLPRHEPASQLREKILHHVAVDVGQAEAAALEEVDQARVVDPQQVQEGGLQVVHVYRAGGEVILTGAKLQPPGAGAGR